MLSSSAMAFSSPIFAGPPIAAVSVKASRTQINASTTRREESDGFLSAEPPISLPRSRALVVAIPLAASVSVLLWSNPGILCWFRALPKVGNFTYFSSYLIQRFRGFYTFFMILFHWFSRIFALLTRVTLEFNMNISFFFFFGGKGNYRLSNSA